MSVKGTEQTNEQTEILMSNIGWSPSISLATYKSFKDWILKKIFIYYNLLSIYHWLSIENKSSQNKWEEEGGGGGGGVEKL